ncbi:cbb3-type cytochrome c oxidase subunit I [Peribacillus frigoritolerans]|nr:cbb3-type cytochrome c oxidase subunit I [Peribacillus frigoritolerans]
MMFDRMFGSNFFDVAAGGIRSFGSIYSGYSVTGGIYPNPSCFRYFFPRFFATFSRKRLFGYSSMVFATVLIGFLGFMVWAHHMFTTGLGPIANAIFAVATMAIAVPTGIKIFNWIFTMWGGSVKFTVPMLYAVAFIPTFTMGGVTGIMLASAPADYQYHDSYFVVAHFHYVIVGGVVLGLLAGINFYWPKMFGTMLSEKLGQITFWTFLIGFHLTFFIQHFLGLMGMPRRVFTFLDDQGLNTGNMISTVGAFLMAFGVLVMVINIIITSVKNEKVGNDPWENGRTLEWAIPSPPPFYNFKQLPLVRGLDPYWVEKNGREKGNDSCRTTGGYPYAEFIYTSFNDCLGFICCRISELYIIWMIRHGPCL